MTAYSTALLGKAKAASQIFSNCCDLISVLRKLFELGPGGKPNIQFSIPDDEIQEVRWAETWITGITSLHLKQIPNHWPEKWFNFSLKVISAVFLWHWSAVAATTLKRSSLMKLVYKTARRNVISESRCTARWKKNTPQWKQAMSPVMSSTLNFETCNMGRKEIERHRDVNFFVVNEKSRILSERAEPSAEIHSSSGRQGRNFTLMATPCEDEDNTINPKKEGVEDAALNTRTSGRSKLSEKQKRSSSWLSFNDADYKAECRICTLKKSVYNK